MDAVATSAQQAHGGLEKHLLLGPALRRLRSSFQTESVDPGARWLVASEGFSAWIRYLDCALGEHLDDRRRARDILTAACAEMVRRRIIALPQSVAQRIEGSDSINIRAFFEALHSGPIARSIRWSLDGITEESPGISASFGAWRIVQVMSDQERWLEASHHFGELAIVLTKILPEHHVPRAIGWLGEVCHAFGKEVAELAESVFGMPITVESAIESLRMGEVLFHLNLEHSSSKPDQDAQSIPWEPKARDGVRQGHMARLGELALGKDPVGGFFGPEGLVWEAVRESAILLGGGRAALMQLAHPAVAHAIRDHSVVHQDMLGRFTRTMQSAYDVLFGSIDDATEISKRVYRIHAAISGKLDDVPGRDVAPYRALDPEAVFWVGATLIDTTMLVYERMVRPMTLAERDRMVRESVPFWVLFGVPAEACAKTWTDLHGYVVRRSESLASLVGDTARTQAALLFRPPLPLVQPIFDQIRLITAELLPAPLQRAFRMELNPRERLLARFWLFAAEQATPHLPSPIRFVPAYHQAQWRLWRAKQ